MGINQREVALAEVLFEVKYWICGVCVATWCGLSAKLAPGYVVISNVFKEKTFYCLIH